jgi:hypothetical protein
MKTYFTFLRSCKNWKEFASAEKIVRNTGLTYEEARQECLEYNANLTEKEKEEGTKLEFTEED